MQDHTAQLQHVPVCGASYHQSLCDTSIHNAAVSIVTHSDIECTLEGQEVEVSLSSDGETNEIAFKLPHMTLVLPSMQTVGVVNHTHQSPPRAWKHEVIIT